jgi:hypothetical protein
MAITDVNLSGYVRADDGDAVSNITISLLHATTDEGEIDGGAETTVTTSSTGYWSFTEQSLDSNYDIKITSEGGGQIRYIPWSDEITLKTVDTSVMKVRGATNTAAAPIYLLADLATDAGDAWRIQATDSDTLAIGSDKASAGTIIDYITITNGANAAASNTTILGQLTIGVDDTGADVKFFGATAGSFLLWDESDDALELTDSSPIKIGDGGDMTIYHDGSHSYITNATGALKLATETSGIAVTIGHTTSEVTIADNLTVTGTLTLGSNAELTEAELELLDGITAGTAIASKVVTTDANIDTSGQRNLTITGELDAATLDISSSADIAGDLVLSGGADGALQFTNAGENSIKIPDDQASALIIEEADNAYITFVTTNSSEAITVAKATTFSAGIADAGTIAAGTWNGTDVGVAYGGTGASSLTDGGVLLGSGTSAVTAMSVLADGEMIVGDGTTAPVAESGATLRTSIGVGTGDAVEFAGITGTTIDATTDFTIGDTVVTNGVITDSSGLALAANVTVTGNILPNADDTYDLGSASAAWQDVYIEGDLTLTDAGKISVGGDLAIEFSGNNLEFKGTGSAATFVDIDTVSGQNARLTFQNGGTIMWNIGNDAGNSDRFTFYDGSSSIFILTSALISMATDFNATVGIRIGANSTNNEIDDSTQGAASTTLYIGNESITTSSDMRLKENIEDSQIHALDLVDKFRVVDFTWADPSDTSEYGRNYRGKYTGMIAQETVKVAPWIINDQGGGRDCPQCSTGDMCDVHIPWHVEYQHLVPTLIKAIQELNSEVQQLKG